MTSYVRISVVNDDVLDLSRLSEAFQTDVSAIAKLLSLARDTEKRHILALRDAIQKQDLRGVARAAHSIKGSASNIGAGKVSSVAADIEDIARTSAWDGISQLADDLDAEYVELCRRIGQYTAKYS